MWHLVDRNAVAEEPVDAWEQADIIVVDVDVGFCEDSYCICQDCFSISVLVENREVRPDSNMTSMLAQNVRTEGVEGGEQHSLTAIRDYLLDARAHLGRGLVGEG
jgi:hypothetical protein